MAMTSDAELWTQIHAARGRLAEDLAGLSEGEWQQPTLCAGWDVEHVVAHLVAAASVGRWRWLRSIVAAGFRPAVHNDRRLREHLAATPADTLENFRAIVDATTAPTGDTAAYLGEVLVHSEDIRRPLALPSSQDIGALTAVAEFYVQRDFTIPSKTRAAGLRLRAVDGPLDTGNGPEAHGPTQAIVMALAGRTAYLAQLAGPGAEVLRQRLPGARAGSNESMT